MESSPATNNVIDVDEETVCVVNNGNNNAQLENEVKKRDLENGGSGEELGFRLAKKAKSGGEMQRVAEIVLVLSAMAGMRGGKNPTEAEVELMEEARAKLVEICTDLKPGDLVANGAIRRVIDDLGLNWKAADQRLGQFRGPTRVSIKDRVSGLKNKMEESKKFTVPSATYTSQMSQPGFGTVADNRGPSHSIRMFPSDKSVAPPLSSGGPPNSSASVHVSTATSASVTYYPVTGEVRASTVSAGLPGSYLGRDTSAFAGPRVEKPLFKPEGGSNGTSYAPQLQVNASASQPMMHSQPNQPRSLQSHPLSAKTTHEGTANMGTLQAASQAARGQAFRPLVAQSPSAILPSIHQPVQGVKFAQPQSHEIAKIVQKLLQPKLPEHPTWTPPSRDYMSKPLACEMCEVAANEVETVLICDACEKGFHLKCLEAANQKGMPRGGEWHCLKCLALSNGKPLPPKYGRVMRSITPPKGPSTSAGAQPSNLAGVQQYIQAGPQLHIPPGSQPPNSAGPQLSNQVGPQPSNPAGPQPSNLAGPQPSNPDGSNPAGLQPSNPAGIQPSNLGGSQLCDPAGFQTFDGLETQPSYVSGHQPSKPAGPQPSNSVGARPSNSAGFQPSNLAGAQPFNPAGAQPSNPAGAQPSNPAGAQPSNPAGAQPSSEEKKENVVQEVNQEKLTENGSSYLHRSALSSPMSATCAASDSMTHSLREMTSNSITLTVKGMDQGKCVGNDPNNMSKGAVSNSPFVSAISDSSIQLMQVSESREQDERSVSESKLQSPAILSEIIKSEISIPSNILQDTEQRELSNTGEVPMKTSQDNCMVDEFESVRGHKDCASAPDVKQCEHDVAHGNSVGSSEANDEARKNSGMSSSGVSNVKWNGSALKAADGKTFYESCSAGGVTYKVQDYALFKSSHEKPTPSKLQAMWEDIDTGFKWVTVRQCYFPADLPEAVGHPCAPESNEVYCSNHENCIKADLIEGPCEVLPPTKYQETSERRTQLETEGKNESRPVFLCKWFYDECKGTFQPVFS
ncbi:uncharacterized protein LOC126669207 [Mercurialis annua]|uniref:uncharacterized protein LOC126669207 n=1 Tax=Mercurialis annua TaxID=3986 RepID=UPI002160F680|nr:uncharacterized protein LOC126669207 [Mercurialis annua]XP_050218571.1 uncharacterized protein LOC126669207 [Mercurialis annua]